MRKGCRRLLRELAPPALVRLFRSCGVQCLGSYASWEEASAVADGYSADIILEKTVRAMRDLKAGKGAYERDTVLFPTLEYAWPQLAGLMWIAAQEGGVLNLLDFGGALGSAYHQSRRFLRGLAQVRWNIVEQKHIVAAGKQEFETSELKFFTDISSCMAEAAPVALCLSSVLQYLPNPHEFLDQIVPLGFRYILLDRTPFRLLGGDLLTVQRVSPSVYCSSYPCWFFNRERLFAHFVPDYELVASFPALDHSNIPSTFEGAILERRPVAAPDQAG